MTPFLFSKERGGTGGRPSSDGAFLADVDVEVRSVGGGGGGVVVVVDESSLALRLMSAPSVTRPFERLGAAGAS